MKPRVRDRLTNALIFALAVTIAAAAAYIGTALGPPPSIVGGP